MANTIDLSKVKRNVAKMVSMNAPESDIDSYISSEGTSIDAIKNYKDNTVSQKQLIPDMTEQQKLSNPTLAGLNQTARDVATIGYQGINGLSLGILGNVLKSKGIQEPNFDNTAPENKSGLNLIGDIANLGGAGKTIGVISGKVGDILNATGVTKAVGNAIDRSKNYIVDAFTGAEKAKTLADAEKFAIQQATADQARGILKTTAMKTGIEQANKNAIGQGYDDLESTLKSMIAKESDKQGLALQKELPKLFARKSTEYGAEQKAIIDALPDEQKVIPSDKVIKSMQDSLTKFGILRAEPSGQVVIARAPMTPTENQIFNLYESHKKFNTIGVEDLMKTQKYIRPEYGKAFSPDEKLATDVANGFYKTITDHVPELKALNQKYAPFLQWKEAAINKFQPFNGQYDVSTGLLSKAGESGASGSQARILAGLRQNIGADVEGKIPALQKGLASIPDKKAAAQKASQAIIDKVRSDAANKIFELRKAKAIKLNDIDNSVNELIHKYGQRKLKIAIAGAAGGIGTGAIGHNALQYFFRREVYSGLNQ